MSFHYSNFVPISFSCLTNLAPILMQCRIAFDFRYNFVPIVFQFRSNVVPISYQFRSNFVPMSYQFRPKIVRNRSNFVLISFKFRTNFVPISYQFRPKFVPNRSNFVLISFKFRTQGHDIEQLIQESVAPGPWAVGPWNERPIWAYGPMSPLAQCPGSQAHGSSPGPRAHA